MQKVKVVKGPSGCEVCENTKGFPPGNEAMIEIRPNRKIPMCQSCAADWNRNRKPSEAR
jgi:hypothetical protein